MADKQHLRKVFLLVGRDNWKNDIRLNAILLENLKRFHCKIAWEDPAGGLIYHLRRLENRCRWLPDFLKRTDLRFIKLIYALTHWNYFSYLHDRPENALNDLIEVRCRKLKQTVCRLSIHHEVIIIARSSGGRVASLIADEVHIKQIICLGYPFKHPLKDTEPDRYVHLERLKTPMLIIQGTEDSYGGLEVKEKYKLSSNVKLFFADTDHNFKVNKEVWEIIFKKIKETIDCSLHI